MTADPRSFADNFFRLTGHSPMRWQQRLFDQFMDGRIPTALDLPTGLGKTSVMAIWLVARAFAGGGALKAIPRRLIYIVDRRAVVDQATEEAERLRLALNGDAALLKEPLGLGSSIFPISTLRGAHVDNREWLDDPAASAIIVGTVDMIGSRLLFEGYGVSRKMRPYHAGLLGADALIVLDEAHLVPPFEALLRRIASGKCEFGPHVESDAKGDAGIVPGFKMLSLSATGRVQPLSDDSAAEGVFHLEDSDLSDTIAKDRLSAPKTLGFVRIGDERDALAEALSQQAWMLSGDGGKPIRCLVYCNSREVAEKVAGRLKGKLDKFAARDKKPSNPKADPELFVGARRVKEREVAKAWLKNHGFLAGSAPPEIPAFLVATSAGEVGIDLDTDHMVCDLVPWERMVQRLGRVNRRGAGNATIKVVHGDESKPKKSDVPMDQEMGQAISFRSLAVLEELPNVEGGKDASPGALRALKLRAETDEALGRKIDEATTPEPLRPALTRALVDAWSMTSLEHHTGRPEIGPWLRGWVENEQQTTVVWRTHLPVRESAGESPRILTGKKEIEGFFDAAPLHESEKLETETYRVAEWLHGRAADALLRRKLPKENVEADNLDELPADEADGSAAPPQPIRGLRRDDIVALILSSSTEYEGYLTLDKLAQDRKGKAKEELYDKIVGKILIVDARFAGLKGGMLDSKETSDFQTADATDDWSKEVGFRVQRVTPDDGMARKDDWRFEDDFVLRCDDNDDQVEWLIVEHYKSTAQSEDARSVSWPQTLADHQDLAEQRARHIGEKIGLSAVALEALALAASVHDEGKRAWRWQRAFKAQSHAKKHGLSGPLAKTRGPIDQSILDGYRHEFGSLAVFEPERDRTKQLPAVARKRIDDLPEDWRDLVLHLIAAHHGQARPVIGTRGCEDAPPSALETRARDVALRFARLQKRWGPWGLAWWEALLRAADQQASRDNDTRGAQTAQHTEDR